MAEAVNPLEMIPRLTVERYIIAGRLPKFKQQYCTKLYEHGFMGYPFDTFGASLGVPQSVIEGWLKEHPTFQRAKEIYDGYFKAHWTKVLANADKSDSSPILLALARNYIGIRTTDAQTNEIPEQTSLIIAQDQPNEETK